MIEIKQKHQGKIVQTDNVRPFKTPAQKKQLRILLLVLVVIIILAAGAYFLIIPREDTYTLLDYDSVVVRSGDLIQTTQASGSVAIPLQLDVVSPDAGYVVKLYTAEGARVEKGDTLAVLSAPDLQDQLEDLYGDLEDSRLNLTKTQTQNRFAIQKMEREMTAQEQDIADMEAEITKLTELVAINASRRSDLETKQQALADLQDKKQESEITLQQEKQLQVIDLEIRKAAITKLETKIDRFLKRIADLNIKAPMNGEILELASSLSVPGSLIAANQFLFTISNPDSAIAELEILEDYAGLLATGQTIQLTISGSTYPGTILSIGKIAQASSDGLGATVQIKVKPQNAGQTLLAGSTAVGTIELGKKEQTLLIPRGPYLTTGSQKYLYRIQDGKAVRVAVTFGSIQGNDVEILNGISAGDTVITSGYQNFIQFKEINLGKGESL